MKMLSMMLFLSMMIVNIKAGEPAHKKFNYGGFFSGVATGYGVPMFFLGRYIYADAKKDLMKPSSCFSQQCLIKKSLVVGKTFRGIGAGLIIIPLLVNNRQLLMDKK